MTTITICKTADGKYTGFTCFGHAGYAKKNRPDILCSAISTFIFIPRLRLLCLFRATSQ